MGDRGVIGDSVGESEWGVMRREVIVWVISEWGVMRREVKVWAIGV